MEKIDDLKYKIEKLEKDVWELQNPAKFQQGDEVVIDYFGKFIKAVYDYRYVPKVNIEEHWVYIDTSILEDTTGYYESNNMKKIHHKIELSIAIFKLDDLKNV